MNIHGIAEFIDGLGNLPREILGVVLETNVAGLPPADALGFQLGIDAGQDGVEGLFGGMDGLFDSIA